MKKGSDTDKGLAWAELCFMGKRRVADAQPGQEEINAENTSGIFPLV